MKDTSLKILQDQMMSYLLHDERAIDEHIVEQGKVSINTRLNIYKNAYKVRLRETIDNDHPILGLYLGDELFQAMVDGYLDQFPSTQTSLRHFAHQLPEFLSNTSPFCDHPILSEIATFERLLLTSFDAADATLFTLETLRTLHSDQWPALRFYFHPSVQLFQSHWNSVESWQNIKNDTPPDKAFSRDMVWLIWRNPDKLTEFRHLTSEELQLLQLALNGKNFSELCDHLLLDHKQEEAAPIALNYLTLWLNSGLIRTA